MSERVDKCKQPLHPYQTQLVSHWSALEQQNQSSTLLGDHGNYHGTNQWHLQKGKEVTSDISGSVKKRTKITAIDFGIVNKKRRRSRKQRESQHTPNVEHVPSLLSLAPPGTESSYMDYHIQHTSVSKCPRELVKSQKIFGSSLEDFNGTSSCVSPKIRCESVRIPTAPSFLRRLEENNNHVTSIPSSKSFLSDTNIMKVLEHEKCSDGSGVLSDNLSMRHNHPPAFREEQYKKMNNFSSTTACPLEANAMSIYTSAEDLDGFIPRCPVNHTLPVMETIETDLRKENKSFRDTRVLTRVQENVPNKCYSIPQLTGHGKQGVEIQVLSSDSEGKDDVHNVSATEVVSKNTSAETHTMDTNMIKEKHLPGIESSSSKKNVNANTDLPHLDCAIGTLGEKVQPQKRPIPAIPDINIPLHAEPAEANIVDNAEPSASHTRSLDLNQLPDSSSKWITRLKISDPCHHSVGTKSLRLDEATTHKSANQFVSRGIRGESSNSEPVPISTGKELMVVNQKTTPLRGAVSSPNGNVDGSDDKKWLHTWIQRWQKSPAATPKNRSEPVVNYDPQRSKENLEELEKKPFSRIAAMALLGKGWSGLKCRYRDEGSYTVWES
ncbi:hypothetical protein POM88_007526 [Heracleum sosnowskyi]|uniref:F-box protein n=1 Tax=Heracleum sosnowskyi TaxID=360622 RepID=A0AAD8J6Y9_9APIA|nr:hypothetical protein POM88_007526 [Heracleum sosnowskyi]